MKPRKLEKRAFARALRHGLGSAFLHVRKYGDGGVEDLLLDACFRVLVYDSQLDSGRASWLARLLDSTGRIEFYAHAIYEFISSEAEHPRYDLEQLICLASELFERGFVEFKQALFALVSSKHDLQVALGEALIDVAGWTGLEAAVRIVAGSDVEGWDKYCLLEYAGEYFDDCDKVETYLQNKSVDDTLVAQFLRDIEDERTRRDSRESSYEPARWTIEEVLDAVENHPNPKSLHYIFRTFGRNASDGELNSVFRRLESESNVDRIASYLGVFASKPLPSVSKPIINLLNSNDEDVRRVARNALSNVKDSNVRKAGLNLIGGANDELAVAGLNLLQLNYQAGDEAMIFDALKRLKDVDYIHWGAMAVSRIAENSGDVALSSTLEWACEFTPCGFCRRSVLEQLIAWEMAPARILYEAQWDAEPAVRRLARASF